MCHQKLFSVSYFLPYLKCFPIRRREYAREARCFVLQVVQVLYQLGKVVEQRPKVLSKYACFCYTCFLSWIRECHTWAVSGARKPAYLISYSVLELQPVLGRSTQFLDNLITSWDRRDASAARKTGLSAV